MSKTAKAAVTLIITGILSKILGFIREIVLASSYGASAYNDAYLISLSIPTIIFASIGGSLITSYIPLFCDIKEDNNEDKAIQFTNNIINMVILISIILIIIGIFFTKEILGIFAVGFKGETLKLAIKFTRILFPGLLFIGITSIVTGYLQIKGNFIIPGLIAIPYNIIIIIFALLSVKTNIYILVYGTLLAIISKILLQIYFAYKEGYRYEPYINFTEENIKKMIYLVAPVFIGISVNQVNILVDRTLASTLVEGSISALNFAGRLNEFVMGLFVTSIATAMYPMLSNLSAKNCMQGFKESVSTGINSITLIVIPIAVGAMALSTPIVKMLFQRGSFDLRATQMTSIALFYYSIGTIGFGLRDVLSRAFYSLQDTKTPMINGAMGMILNIILNLILVKHMAHAGLAFATSISGLVTTGLLFYSLRKKIGSFCGKKIISVMIKVIISSIAMGIVVKVFYNFIYDLLGKGFIFEAVSLGSSIIVGGVVYAALIFTLKIEEVHIFIDIIKSKLKKKII